MPWFEFTHDFNWHVPERKGAVTIAYKAGMKLLVREACIADAEAAGRGHRYRKDDPEDLTDAAAEADGGDDAGRG